MFPRSLRLLQVRGVDVRIDPSWLLIAVLVVASFQARWSGPFGPGTALAMSVAASLLFFTSVLVHELGHAFEARHRDLEVGAVTLFFLGGVTEMHGEAERPRDEFVVAAVGPFLSLVLGAFFGIATTVVDFWTHAPAVEHVLGLLGWINVGLAVFNLVPGAPLDGGRVLRAGLWWLLGDRRSAMTWSARAGQGFAVVLWALAARTLLTPSGSLADALWVGFVGWFLWRGARGELRHAALGRLLEGERAGALDIDVVAPVDAGVTLSVLTGMLGGDLGDGARPVGRNGEVVGALVMDDVRKVHEQDQTFRVAEDVMRPAFDLPHVASDMLVWDVLQLFQRQPLALLDLDDGRTTTLTSAQFGEALERLRRRQRGKPTQKPVEAP